jgi:hypothetical protein
MKKITNLDLIKINEINNSNNILLIDKLLIINEILDSYSEKDIKNFNIKEEEEYTLMFDIYDLLKIQYDE